MYTSPPDCSKWCSSISLLDYALNRESYNIASAILRAGANPSSYLIKDCPNCNYDDVVKWIKCVVKENSVRTQFMLWILRALVCLRKAVIERFQINREIIVSCVDVCSVCNCSCPVQSLLFWECCEMLVCLHCYWTKTLLGYDGTYCRNTFNFPDIYCPTCKTLYSNLRSVQNDPTYTSFFKLVTTSNSVDEQVDYIMYLDDIYEK